MPVEIIDLPTTEGVVLSARIARAQQPRSTIVALHGGGLHAGYFDGRTHPDTSFLTLGSQLGHDVVAIDRPGYGVSAGTAPELGERETQARLVSQAVRSLTTESTSPVFLLGHSFGSMVAMTMAADPDTRDKVRGLAISGVGFRYSEALLTDPDRSASRETHWGPESFYPPSTFEPGVRPHATIPPTEADTALAWPASAHAVVGRITVPVSITVAEREMNWSNTPYEFAALFSSAPRVEVMQQIHSGHNMSLGWTARPYHLRTIAFFEECLVTALD